MLTVVVLLCITAYGAVAGPIVPRDNEGTYRLSGEIVPSEYDIYIDVSQTLTKKEPWEFQGSVTINAKSTSDKEIKEIILHASDMNITAIKVNNADATHKIDETHEFLKITLAKAIAAQENVKIIIQYKGYLQDNMYGFYISSYKNKENEDEYVATTQFQATHARKAFPCFDEPQYKAQFKIKIAIPDGYTAISNMPAKNTYRAEAKVVEFEQTPIMSTYLVAFIVSKFKCNVGGDSQYKVCARPTAIDQTKYAASIVKNLTEEMTKFTKVNYFEDMKMKKMDMVALPDFAAGAMENWGLLTYRETALLVDDKVSTKRNVQRVASVITHELAHQWFGDYVTTEWWNNTWLNEGFATYFEYHITGASVFIVDSLDNTTPLNYHVETPTQISSHFGSISYNKGGSVIRMMEHFLGTDNFKTGLQKYLKKNAFSTTTPDQLWESFTEVDKMKLSEIMKNWINNPGYPVIHVSRDEDTITIKQERFHLQSENKIENKNDKWYVPISYTTSSDKSFDSTKPKEWLKDSENEKKFKIDSNYDWIIMNIQGSGYYRVNYDDNLWSEIQKVLKSDDADKIHRLNRAQLIDDAMNLARAGQLDYTVALEIVDYLTTETDYYPWYSAFAAFRYLLQRYADDDDTGSDIRAYILTLMDALTKDITFNIKSDDMKPTDVYQHVNALKWACDLGEEKCVSESKILFEKLKNNTAEIDKNIKSVVYCTAIRHGTKEDWNHLWEMYETSNVNAEQVTILSALGCAKDEDQLKGYLEKSITSIRKQDAASVFSAVYTGNSVGVLVAFDFLKENYKKIATQYGGMNALGNAIRGLADRLNTDDQITEFETFLKDKEEELKEVKEIAAAAIEKAKANVNWANKYKAGIATFLKTKKSGSSAVMSSAVLCVALATLASYYTLL
ncbi:uncharacterized protein CBL_04526 [Carabus blaptoides fortunei]